MIYRRLGRTELKVSLAGLGTGGPARIGQSAGLAVADSVRLVHRALELGVNLLDTSPVYGESEVLLGKALVDVPRDSYVLATKYPPDRSEDARPDDLMRVLEKSLRLLGVETIDVLQYHAVGNDEYERVRDLYHDAALKAKAQGKVRFLGITESVALDPEHEMLKRALAEGIFDTCMLHHGILNQRSEGEVFGLVRQHDVGVFVMAPVRTSLRTPAEAVERITGFIAEGLIDGPLPTEGDPLGLGMADEPVPSLTRAAYQFAAANPAVSTVLFGTGSISHLEQNIADLTSGTLSPPQLAYLRERYGALAWNH